MIFIKIYDIIIIENEKEIRLIWVVTIHSLENNLAATDISSWLSLAIASSFQYEKNKMLISGRANDQNNKYVRLADLKAIIQKIPFEKEIPPFKNSLSNSA